MNYLIIDLECTCDENNDNWDRSEMETIEIGAVLVDSDFNEIGEFSTFVKPVINPILTEFCTKLTTITQDQVDNAPLFEEAIKSLKEFSSQKGEYTFCSWGGFDYRQIKREAKLKGINNPMSGRNINYKENYQRIRNQRATSITKSLKSLGLRFEGTQHRGIDDAKNILRIVKKIGI